MRTIKTKLFNFDELSKEAQETAIEQIRENHEMGNDFWEWAKDDCSLLEPPHEELVNLFGNDYEFPLIKNLRDGLRVYEDTADLSKGAQITNGDHFLEWLGLDTDCNYKIVEENILLWLADDREPTEEDEDLFGKAQTKFREHLKTIFDRVESSYDYRFSDEAIKEDIAANDWEFTADGSIY